MRHSTREDAIRWLRRGVIHAAENPTGWFLLGALLNEAATGDVRANAEAVATLRTAAPQGMVPWASRASGRSSRTARRSAGARAARAQPASSSGTTGARPKRKLRGKAKGTRGERILTPRTA